MIDGAVLEGLLDSDPTRRWQVERDLAGAPPVVWRATRARVATEGD
ncbi:MAG: squalene cyclase, partial [Microbacterium sp.]